MVQTAPLLRDSHEAKWWENSDCCSISLSLSQTDSCLFKVISLVWTQTCETESLANFWTFQDVLMQSTCCVHKSLAKPQPQGQVASLILLVVRETFGNQTEKETLARNRKAFMQWHETLLFLPESLQANPWRVGTLQRQVDLSTAMKMKVKESKIELFIAACDKRFMLVYFS